MREIKFRAWDKDSKEMRLDVTPGPFSKIYPNEIWTDCGFTGEHGYLEDAILMQYTGLKDKNGKEIYEGDVIRYFYPSLRSPQSKFIGEVIFENRIIEHTHSYDANHVGFIIRANDKGEYWYTDFPHNADVEVIGNVYENPELLTP